MSGIVEPCSACFLLGQRLSIWVFGPGHTTTEQDDRSAVRLNSR